VVHDDEAIWQNVGRWRAVGYGLYSSHQWSSTEKVSGLESGGLEPDRQHGGSAV